jgi:hypothetical protein
MPPLIKGVLIGFFGSASQFSVDKYKLDPALALMFNLLVVVWSCGEPPSCFTALDCLALDFSNRRARERLGEGRVGAKGASSCRLQTAKTEGYDFKIKPQ